MEKIWIFIVVILIFLTCIFLFWKLTRDYGKKGHGTKLWKHWPTRLAYWQAAVLYSVGFTVITVFFLKWIHFLPF